MIRNKSLDLPLRPVQWKRNNNTHIYIHTNIHQTFRAQRSLHFHAEKYQLRWTKIIMSSETDTGRSATWRHSHILQNNSWEDVKAKSEEAKRRNSAAFLTTAAAAILDWKRFLYSYFYCSTPAILVECDNRIEIIYFYFCTSLCRRTFYWRPVVAFSPKWRKRSSAAGRWRCNGTNNWLSLLGNIRSLVKVPPIIFDWQLISVQWRHEKKNQLCSNNDGHQISLRVKTQNWTLKWLLSISVYTTQLWFIIT